VLQKRISFAVKKCCKKALIVNTPNAVKKLLFYRFFFFLKVAFLQRCKKALIVNTPECCKKVAFLQHFFYKGNAAKTH
jgi:hypothetical protein